MISQLTDAQLKHIEDVKVEWLAHGLSTERSDRKAAEEGAILAYKIAGLVPPTDFYWTRSPLEGARKAAELLNVKSASEVVDACVRGQHDAGWLAFLDCFNFVDGFEKLEGVIKVAKSTGWWWPLSEAIVFSERPLKLKFDDRKLLHCEDGPAILYEDGLVVYAWHGTTIPADWIENKENLDPKTALTWENIEQRRCAAEIIGWDKVLSKLNSKVIDEDADPEIGTLVEVNLPDIGKERFLRVMCGTKRQFALPVPPNMRTALEAQAWTWGLSKDEFKQPEVRT